MKRSVNPCLSVVMATRNRQTLLPLAVESILDQTFADFELIIVDDASTDETPAVLAKLEKQDQRVRTTRLDTNSGPGTTRNVGMHQAVGTYVAIMDDDDLAEPDRFETQVSLLESQPDVDLVFSPVTWMDASGQASRVFPNVVTDGAFPSGAKEIFYLLYLESNKIPNTTIMFRRTLLDLFDGYPPTPWIGEDWYWFMQMAASGVPMVASSRSLVWQRRDNWYMRLMNANPQTRFTAQRQVLKNIRVWLKRQKILFPSSLHRLALSNQFVREARAWGGMRGLFLCQRALLLAPTNNYAWSTLGEIVNRGRQKVGATPGLFQDE